MKGFSRFSTKGRGEKNRSTSVEEVVIDWEVRPGGLLVQKRSFIIGEFSSDHSSPTPAATAGPLINIKVSHDSYLHHLTLPSQSTFGIPSENSRWPQDEYKAEGGLELVFNQQLTRLGDLKKVLARETGLEPKDQRLLFRGKEKDEDECLHMAGVKDMSKVILLEDPASKERKLEDKKKNGGSTKTSAAIAKVRAEVDKLSNKVVTLERSGKKGINITEKEITVLTELLMMELLKLDSIEADGDAKMQRRIEVCRIQSFVDTLDDLKARSSNNFGNRSSDVSVTTKWETFDSGIGSLAAPKPLHTSTKVTHNWEQFD